MSRARKPASNPGVAVAYLRVSTVDQTTGLEAQRESIERWAATNGVAIVAYFYDQGISGAAPLDERVGLLDALSALKLNHAGVLLIAKRDRLARDVGAVAAIERLTMEAGANIATADGLDASNTPEGQLIRAIVDAMSQYERSLIRTRTAAALRVKKLKGERIGSIPLGFLANEQGKLVPCIKEQAALLRMRELVAHGCSQREICRKLTSEGYQPRGKKWNITTISRALRRSA